MSNLNLLVVTVPLYDPLHDTDSLAYSRYDHTEVLYNMRKALHRHLGCFQIKGRTFCQYNYRLKCGIQFQSFLLLLPSSWLCVN